MQNKDTQDSLILYHSRKSLFLMLIGSIIFIILGVGLYLSPEIDFNPWESLIGFWIGVPFFLMIAIVLGKKLLVRNPALILDEKGIVDQSSAISAGRIHWSEISEMYIYKFKGEKFLGICVKEENVFFQRLPKKHSALRSINSKIGGLKTSVNISQRGLPLPLEVILKKAERLHQKHQERNH